jgi:hypothetical protein
MNLFKRLFKGSDNATGIGSAGEAGIFLQSSGYCAVCGAQSEFIARHHWLRDHFLCQRCGSIPRERALLTVLEQRYPDWRERSLHESSPGSPSSTKLAHECKGHVASHYFMDVAGGGFKDGMRSENLERQTFADASFDLVITQDVMEHVFDLPAAYREIARTLKPGGAHIFTTPVYKGLAKSELRARLNGSEIEYLAEAEYHGNPIDPTKGALVTIHYGADIGELIQQWSGLPTTVYVIRDLGLGIAGEFLEVMVSYKPL